MDAKTTAQYTGLLKHLKKKLVSVEFMKQHRRDEKAFSRKRTLTFVVVVVFLLNMIKRALQDELDELFKTITGSEFAERKVSKSAFTQARKKLKYTAFIDLNQEQVSYFYAHYQVQRWQGNRLLALDGSMTDLPNTPALQAHFGYWRPAAGGQCAKARVSQLFDVLNKVTLDALIRPKQEGELSLAALHCLHLREGDVVLMDRGYPAFWLFVLIRHHQAHFCARISLSGWAVVADFVASGAREQLVNLQPCYNARKACQERELPITPLPVRLLRLEQPGQEPLVLVTSLLDQDRFPYDLFADLYSNRWPVETDYDHMKLQLQVENWSGSSVEAIYQDFHATVFSKNLAAIIAQPVQLLLAEQPSTKKHAYQVNMANLYSKLKDTLVSLFLAADPLPWLQFLWRQMASTLEPIRPKRVFPRKKKVKPKRFPMNRKPLR